MIMTDQYNMDQYNKETSQIHAPADLIRRTKEAVHEEEQRLERERLQKSAVMQQKSSYGKVYRWVLPVAAAVFCVIMLNVSGMIVGRNTGGGLAGSTMGLVSESATSNTPASDNGRGAQFGAADWSEDAVAAADEPIDMNGDYGMASTAEETSEEAVTTEGYDGGQTADAAVSQEREAFTDSAPENDIYEQSGSKNAGSSYIKSIYGSDLWIEEVEESPAFCDNPDTECVTIQDLKLYVGKDYDGAWIAYTEVDSVKYIINSELIEEEISREDFAWEAYELLMKTTGK